MRVHQAQHRQVALDLGIVIVIADLAQHLLEAALVDEHGTAAGAQVQLLERHDDLGGQRRRVTNMSVSSARSRCLRMMALLRMREANMGLAAWPGLSASASPMAVRFRTRLDEAPASELRLRNDRSIAMNGILRRQEFHRDAVAVMAHHPPQGAAEIDGLADRRTDIGLQRQALQRHVQDFAAHLLAIAAGKAAFDRQWPAIMLAQPGRRGDAMGDEPQNIRQQALALGLPADKAQAELAPQPGASSRPPSGRSRLYRARSGYRAAAGSSQRRPAPPPERLITWQAMVRSPPGTKMVPGSPIS